MRVAVVIPACRGREDNIELVLDSLQRQSRAPELVLLVEDGDALAGDYDCHRLQIPKHEPGMDQPRNMGVRTARLLDPDITHAWFLDSDVIVGPDCLEQLELVVSSSTERATVVAPYDWMPAGAMSPIPDLYNDPRWAMFRQRDGEVMRGDLSAGLACFSGNLLWDVDEFIRVGGFWSEIHHGRCEDGELGIRAVAMDVAIVLAPKARGWHLWHARNDALAFARNQRDVPMLNERHPWMIDRGVFMVDRDGKAFDVRCSCGAIVATNAWWAHAETCGKGMGL